MLKKLQKLLKIIISPIDDGGLYVLVNIVTVNYGLLDVQNIFKRFLGFKNNVNQTGTLFMRIIRISGNILQITGVEFRVEITT